MATIKEIAEMVGVSSSAVSRVLNYDEGISVSDETREAIFATAEIVPRNLFAVDIDDEITLRRAVIVEQTVQAQCPRGLGDGDRGEVVDIVVPLGFARIKISMVVMSRP